MFAMATLESVPLLATPDDFAGLHSGNVTLHNVPFFEDTPDVSALQVGLEPSECTDAPKYDVVVAISEVAGQHAIEFARADHQPFMVEWTDESDFRQPAINRPVESLRLTETEGLWLSVEVPGDEPLLILKRPGINCLAQVLTMFALRAQASAENDEDSKSPS